MMIGDDVLDDVSRARGDSDLSRASPRLNYNNKYTIGTHVGHGRNHGLKDEVVQHVANHLSSPYHKIYDATSRDQRNHNLW